MTKHEFLSLTQSKVVLLDGPTGSNLHKKGMSTGVCPELWMLENKETVINLQKEFLMAGTDILYSPTFTANRIKLKEYHQDDRIVQFNQELVGISREAISRYQSNMGDDRKVYIAGDMTMTGQQVYPVGQLAFEELVEVYKEQVSILLAAGVDLFVIETMMSLSECRAALLAVKELCDLPVMVSLTFTESGLTFYGTDPKTAIIVLQSMGADAVGVNCSTGPDKMVSIVKEMKEYACVPIMAKPNAGIPKLIDNETVFPMGAEEFAEGIKLLCDNGASIVGGCCGSTPEHIRLMVEKVKDLPPAPVKASHVRALTTERSTTTINLDGRFMVIGERINPTGKKKLQEQLREGNLELVTWMAKEQAKQGANILDINVGMNGIDEKELMQEVMHEVLRVVDIPLCIDSSNIDVIEAVLRQYPGRALINSISLEKVKYDKLIPIANKYGAMFILLPISDKGLPKDIEEKKEIISTILKRAYSNGLTKDDIIIDGLVTTVGANKNAAIQAVETIRYCKNELGIATCIGLSNISYGLPNRQYINSAFLSFAMKAGLTMAIANPSQALLMNASLACDLLMGKEDAAINYIEKVVPLGVKASETMTGEGIKNKPVDKADDNKLNNDSGMLLNNIDNNNKDACDKVYNAVVKGDKRNIISFVNNLLDDIKPEDIVACILIPAINQVGKLFDKQVYFLPQLIASAEAMKEAVDYLEPKLKKEGRSKSIGTVIIATVAGDVHDIGKNLVALMLKNYGFKVIDLGKDVPSDKIISKAREENADIIALSALMTTTMTEMKNVVEMVKKNKLKAKVIIGGAVVTQAYADEIGAHGYSPDAGSAVNLVKMHLDNS